MPQDGERLYSRTSENSAKANFAEIHLPHTRVNSLCATLKPLDASHALRPTRGRSRQPPLNPRPYDAVVGASFELLVVCGALGVAVVLGVGLVDSGRHYVVLATPQ